MKRFTNNIVSIKRGDADVDKVYKGAVQVWPDEPLCQSPLISNTNLAIYYKMDGNADDSSGNSRNATAENVSFVTSRDNFNQCGSFTPPNSRIYISNDDYSYTNNLPALSVSLWINNNSLTPNLEIRTIIAKYNATAPGSGGFDLRLFGTNVAGSLRQISFVCLNPNIFPNESQIRYNWTPNLNQWYHIAAVFSNSRAKIYIDGTLVGTATNTVASLANGTQPLTVGYASLNTTTLDNIRHFDGLIDDVTVWERELTSTEIETLADICPFES